MIVTKQKQNVPPMAETSRYVTANTRRYKCLHIKNNVFFRSNMRMDIISYACISGHCRNWEIFHWEIFH